MESTDLILIVDDDPYLLASTKMLLEDFDYDVMEAENGSVGLELFRKYNPDLVLIDIYMPEINGLDVLRTIVDESPDTPTVMLSGSQEIKDVVAAMDIGAWSYLLKPIHDSKIILHAIKKELERAKLRRENREYKDYLEKMVLLRTRQLEAAYSKLQGNYQQIIRSLGRAAEVRDNETGAHTTRVSKYSQLLAKAKGLPDRVVDLIGYASLMHDIGKIGTPDNILLKPGRLNEAEEMVMREHCESGVEILDASPLLEGGKRSSSGLEDSMFNSEEADADLLIMARIIAACHHERWDGDGYPNKLKGEEIPIEARIVSLADVYDALSSRRPYKQPWSEEKCQKTIRAEAGKAFDPELVNLFFENIAGILDIKATWPDSTRH